jgi:NAD(P)-dependent dehydrogenase (short-subunit alcohol dehydrogenase family)
MRSSFAGKVALITGGTSGIGRATAVAFAEQGASVVVAGRREAEGAESVALIEKAGGNGLFVRTDVISEEQIAKLVARTVEHFGQLDFAFNNAGVGGEAGLGVRVLAMHPIGRFGYPEEVAAAVLYLCSPQAAFITGVALPLDGGLAA